MDNRQMESSMSTSDRTLAAGAHLSGVFFPFFGPLAFFMFSGKHRFAKYHSLHALVGMLILNFFLFTAGAISLGFSLYNLWQQYQQDFKNFEWWPMLLKSAITWIVLLLIGVVNTIVNIVQAIRAYQGKVPGKSMTTAIVNRFVRRPELPEAGTT